MDHHIVRLLRERVPPEPIVILMRPPLAEGRTIEVQDYQIDGEFVIPVFSSPEAFRESTGGNLGKPTMAIARPVIGQMLKGSEVFLLDPRLATQLRFTAGEFREAFPEKFEGSGAGE